MSEALPKPHDWSQTRTLYVVLQGEFALYRQPTTDEVSDRLRILAPNIPGHVYKAGPWLTDWKNQPELPCSKLTLRHAFGDRKQRGDQRPRAIPEQNTDIIMSLGAEAPSPENARLDISAPMPLAILPGLIETSRSPVSIKVKKPDGSDAYPPVPATPTVIPILVYKWYAGSGPYLWSDESRTKWLPAGPSDDFQSIQIYASSPCPGEEDSAHAKAAFRAAAALLGEDAQINWTDGSFSFITANPPAGLAWAQVNMFLSQVLKHDPCDPQLTWDEWDQSLISGYDDGALVSASSGNCGPITGG